MDRLETAGLPSSTRIQVWQAKCHLHLSEPQRSIQLIRQAADPVLAEAGEFRDYARLILARALMKLGEPITALGVLARAAQEAPRSVPLRRMLADLLINVQGDWSMAAKVLSPLQGKPTEARAIDAFLINRQRYIGSHSAEALSVDILQFAERHLLSQHPAPSFFEKSMATAGSCTSRRRRLGLISPMFNASPVYFLCIGALRHLAGEFDLVFFSRDSRQDWAQDAFRAIATEWQEIGPLSVTAITHAIRSADLYALIDMGGWLDLSILQALAQKPAPLQIKWVGGQSTTTGLHSFDAYITDLHQSPEGSQKLHSEPLAYMPNGYVTYTPPAYLPESAKTATEGSHTVVGIVAHPKKLSQAFLAYISHQIALHQQTDSGPVELHFIGWQFESHGLQRRLQTALALDNNMARGGVQAKFLPSKSHLEQLTAIGRTDWIVDTFPYTGGLTALEALALGVPYRTHAGQHCSARHAYSHARFAPLEPSLFNLETLGAFKKGPLENSGKSLLPKCSPRLNHQRLANDMAKLLHNPIQFIES